MGPPPHWAQIIDQKVWKHVFEPKTFRFDTYSLPLS
jgi:hypothetical protein